MAKKKARKLRPAVRAKGRTLPRIKPSERTILATDLPNIRQAPAGVAEIMGRLPARGISCVFPAINNPDGELFALLNEIDELAENVLREAGIDAKLAIEIERNKDRRVRKAFYVQGWARSLRRIYLWKSTTTRSEDAIKAICLGAVWATIDREELPGSDDKISRIEALLEKIVAGNAITPTAAPEYSKPHAPSHWREAYAVGGVGISQDKFAGLIKNNKIRTHPNSTTKSISIDTRDLPPGYVDP